ncbi:aplysianin-A-like isoform X2 [Ruditapes philippinarum]|uniref:aplysianin-A-like isoform X2 n=2 Tax=Ruditapes philippinarum TaxID=129788 RepID=UPI00295AD1E1|nr:aplysianin-A-like isoform X2 [Ruditapes philippinarum]
MVYQQNKTRHRIIFAVGAILLISGITGTFLGEETCDDVVIVGAGVSGSYLAWKLRNQNLTVTVYEYSDRVGGRMLSVHFKDIPDINIELGAMRFLPDLHPLMNSTAHALGLHLIDFKSGVGHNLDTLMYTRGQHFKLLEATTKGPYNLLPNERLKDDRHLRWSIFINETDFLTAKPDIRNISSMQFLKTKDGIELYKQSEVVADATMGLSEEATELLRDTFGFHGYYGDISAAVIIPGRDPDGPVKTFPVKTIYMGMDQIPQRLISEFLNASSSNRLQINHRLKKIVKRKDDAFNLELQKTVTTNGYTVETTDDISVCAKKVVLAVPRLPLGEIDWTGLQSDDVADIIQNAARDTPAAKVFLAFDKPWWRDTNYVTNHFLTDRPNRQTYDFGTSAISNRSVLLAVYTDMEDVKFWRELQSSGNSYKNCSLSASSCASERVITMVQKFLAEIYNVSLNDIPEPLDTAISLWDKYPSGAAWHVWRKGYIWNQVQDRMIQPSPADNIYLSSGTFDPRESDAWAESALSAAESVFKRIVK